MTYAISLKAIEIFQEQQQEAAQQACISEKLDKDKTSPQKTLSNQHSGFINAWKDAMENGLMTGKPFSRHTSAYYSAYIEKFLVKYKALSLDNLKAELVRIPGEQFGKKDKFFKAVVCFAKFLISEKALSKDFLEQIAPLKPKRSLPPKRLSVDEDGLKLGQTMDRHGLRHRLERLGEEAGVTVSPHALRRAFVTINANKGRPLQMLQMACGHSDIKTTMSYCRTAENEVIEAMKGWD